MIALVASACGGDAEPDDATGSDTEVAADDQSSDPDALAFDGDEADTTNETSSTQPPVTQPADTTPTTEGSGLDPVTTVAVTPPGDPDGIYRGVIGGLDSDQELAPAVVDPPSTAAGTQPLTGLDGTVPTRPAAVVKMDNGKAAHPQTGLNAADIVIEEEVEGGVTRFAAIFHSTPSIVGPVRSGRTTDVALISGLGEPLLVYSGANTITDGIIRRQPGIQNRSYDSSSGYWRDDERQAPSNLYTDTAPHWASADGGPPPAQFHYRPAGTPAPTGTATDSFTVAYPASTAAWTWDGDRWLRSQWGRDHVLRSGQQVSAVNVVVIEAERVDTGMVDASGGAVPEFVFVGTGAATIFTDGKRIEATWTKPTLTSVATLTDADGDPIGLTPGRTWVQLVDAGSDVLR